jgi:ankyrin repeat protein/cell wall assembly regulator SMI1
LSLGCPVLSNSEDFRGKGAELNVLEKLESAIRKREADLVEKLLAEGAPVNKPFKDGKFPLAYAVYYESPEIVRALLRARADVNARNAPDQDTALLLAAYHGCSEIAKLLLAAGANPNSENILTFTPLQESVQDRTAAHLELTRSLIAAGAHVNSGKFVSVLMTACRSGSPEIVEALLQAGADINAVWPRGTALTAAVEANRPDNVSVLLANGADPALRTPAVAKHPGLTPLELAKKLKHRKVIALLEEALGISPPESVQPPRCASAAASWEEIEMILRKHRPRLARSLRKAASKENLSKVEQVLGLSLPEEFKEFYLLHDGQKADAAPMVPPGACGEDGYRLLPLREALAEWRRWKKLTDMGEFRGMKSGPDKGVRDDWWSPGWVPFADNGRGDLLCLDMAPAPGGRRGQIITMNHASTKRERLAPSLAHWLSDLATFLKANRKEKGPGGAEPGGEETGTP